MNNDDEKNLGGKEKDFSATVNDSRYEGIKSQLDNENNLTEEQTENEVLDGQVGLDDLLAQVEQTSEDSATAGASLEQQKEIKKQVKQEMLVKAGLGKNVIQKSVEVVMHESMMPYSEHVILDRALPRVEDGLKPVQRRILYSMLELGVTPDKPYRKSARIVGDCLGKYHPHGDTSVYDAMVRMAQPFSVNEILIDGHGNFGSEDGDGPAAMRYTEARLAPLALEMLRDIDKDTVEWSFNFDDTLKEPNTLPSRYPNLLVNGATGIAVGLATNIPPHNLGEVISGVIAYIENPNIKLKEMMRYIKGPDFPTGGYIIGGDELVNAYETGKGKILIRAKAHIELGDNDKKSIVITEFPYQVKKAALLSKILDVRESKKNDLVGISEILDESDRNGTRAVIRVKKDYDPKKILDLLYKYTDLQVSYGINMVVVADGKPQQLGLLPIIKYYVDYQQKIIYRRTKFDLDNAKEREHILEGLVIAVKNIDEVIKIIKTSENTPVAKRRLMERFKLSDRQAQAILDLRLARLTHLEVYKLEQELAEVRALIKKLTEILNSKKLQLETVKNELLEIKKKFKNDRVTSILAGVDNFEIKSYDDKKPVESVVIGITKQNTIKSLTLKHFNGVTKEFGEKSNNYEVYRKLYSTQSDKQLMFFTDKGNAYKINAEDIPDCKWREKGIAFNELFKDAYPTETAVAVFEIPDQTNEEASKQNLMFFSKLGMIKKTPWSEYYLLKNIFQASKFKDDDKLVDVVMENEDPKATICFVTKNGNVLNAFTDDIPVQGRISGGVKGVALGDGDEVVFMGYVVPSTRLCVITDKGYAKKVKLSEIEPMARYRKGVRIITFSAASGTKIVFASAVNSPYSVVVEDADGNRGSYSTDSFENQPRTGSGKSIVRSKQGIVVKDVSVYLNQI